MNISKTNSIGLKLIEDRFNFFKKSINEFISKPRDKEVVKTNKSLFLNHDLFQIQKDTKFIRVTDRIIENAKLIDFENIRDNINVLDFEFDNIVILLSDDDKGIIKINRYGTDFHFFYVKGLKTEVRDEFNICVDLYSFLTKEFFQDDIHNNQDMHQFVIKLITYLFYGEITTKVLPPKSKSKINFYSTFNNDSNLKIVYADSNWKQRICVNGFSVSGHFRLQPIGEKRSKRKLIWIDEFKKQGYNRKATIEKL